MNPVHLFGLCHPAIKRISLLLLLGAAIDGSLAAETPSGGIQTDQESYRDLVEDIRAARFAVQNFETWLKEQRPAWTAAAGVGEAAFDWYLKHVKLMPWTSVELVLLGRRELGRLWANYALERHRNRALPELEPAISSEDYQQRIEATDKRIRAFLEQQSIITVPGYIGKLDTNAPWIIRASGRNFWEEIQFRDPSPGHLHAVIPGHRFDGLVASRNDHPVRGKIFSAARVDAEIYLRRPPGYGIGYTIGSLQMQRLLADRKRQLGDNFDLKVFHNAIMSSGRLPLSLLRWEVTGLDDEVKRFWEPDPMPD